jgi:hypothetical protein
LLEEDGLPGLALGLALTCLFALCLLQLQLDVGGLAELFGVDGVGDAGPELEGLVGQLLLLRGQNLGGDIERLDVDNKVLLLGGYRFLPRLAHEKICAEQVDLRLAWGPE